MQIINIKGEEFIITGKLCRTIRSKSEWEEDILDPAEALEEIKRRRIRADVFTFAQKLPHIAPMYHYPMCMTNVAALPVTTFENWWTTQAFKQVRKNVRRSERKGVIIKQVEFDDKLIKGIQEIYNETKIRQGKLNRHYGKSFEETKRANITYIDRSDFIGAYIGDELIGFVKLVYTKTNSYGRLMGIEGKIKYRGIGYMHALIAKAVEICAEKQVPYIVYGRFIYGTKGPDSVTMFKLYNGFQKFELPRYYIPLNTKGKVLFALGLHKDFNEIIPGFILRSGIRIRRFYYEARYWKDFKADKRGMDSEK